MDGPRPYDFEPMIPEGEIGRHNIVEEFDDESDEEIEIPAARLLNNDWCLCGYCAVMPTLTECRCCREGRDFQRFLGGDGVCVTLHEEFPQICFLKHILRATLIMTNDIRGHTGDVPRELEARSYRYSAYRLFTYWIHDKLGKGVRKVIPSCAVVKIREMFPDPHGVYTGFKLADDGQEIEVGEVEMI